MGNLIPIFSAVWNMGMRFFCLNMSREDYGGTEADRSEDPGGKTEKTDGGADLDVRLCAPLLAADRPTV